MLKTVLLANAATCATFGLSFLLMATPAAAFLGDPPVHLLRILGAGLIINAVLMIFTGLQKQPSRKDVLMFAIGDAAWVVFTIILLLTGIWITTRGGIIAALCVAIFVGLCGWIQWRQAPELPESIEAS